MLESIHLENFQCHQNRTIKFDEITVLVGENGSGKTAAIRGLLWLALGEWEGAADEMVAWDAETCTVTAVFDGQKISRSRNPNLYLLEGERFEGVKIPDQVSKLLNLSLENFQQQDDPAFWLSLNSGQAASALNEIFNLSAIDEAIGSVASELRAVRGEITAASQRKAEALEEAKKLRWAKRANIDLVEIEALVEQEVYLMNEIGKLEEAIEASDKLNKQRLELIAQIELGEAAVKAAQAVRKLESQVIEIEEILALEDQACQLAKTLNDQETKLTKALEKNCPMCGR